MYGCLINSRYHVSDANSYLVITGGGVKDVKIVKKAWILPWQKVRVAQCSPSALDDYPKLYSQPVAGSGFDETVTDGYIHSLTLYLIHFNMIFSNSFPNIVYFQSILSLSMYPISFSMSHPFRHISP